ncbi:hypothetical protein [Salinimicrobium sp. TH3]|uniref:hypothetical protein n=1 Tax=Salinimicrobium sp. TH3 TaxID=2997342 RepID=UPI00227701B0|nr:hypothetical protein [Salinimicrobium sp. TH3]MCY2687338.1 hypothetical protein [Salinimicrobium sp. TH3]
MESSTHLFKNSFTAALSRRILIGAAFAFVLITLFVMGVDNPDPEWPKYWKIRPIVVTSIAGGIGGAFADFMHLMRREGGIYRGLGIVLSLVGYVVILWLGSVFGLAGTLWN